MERFQHLIDKLTDQKSKGEDAARLLITVQELHRELALLVQRPEGAGSYKVAVVMPASRTAAPAEVAEESAQPAPAAIPEADRRFIPAEPQPLVVVDEETTREPAIQSEEPQVHQHPPRQPYALQKPFFELWDSPEDEKAPKELFSLTYDESEELEAPTLPRVAEREQEVHEVITEKRESLNDRLKQEQLELGATLKEAPIKDLRKGIGVNDKFLFISELFRGDEDMYERSIKTINGFRILPEAEYWINRELKVKLGWNDTKDTVQHFYAVVRRRFAAM